MSWLGFKKKDEKVSNITTQTFTNPSLYSVDSCRISLKLSSDFSVLSHCFNASSRCFLLMEMLNIIRGLWDMKPFRLIKRSEERMRTALWKLFSFVLYGGVFSLTACLYITRVVLWQSKAFAVFVEPFVRKDPVHLPEPWLWSQRALFVQISVFYTAINKMRRTKVKMPELQRAGMNWDLKRVSAEMGLLS